MNQLISMMAPELILTGIACILFLLGCSNKASSRRMAPMLALFGLVAALTVLILMRSHAAAPMVDVLSLSIYLDGVAHYIRPLALAVGMMLLLLSWPSNAEQTGNSAIHYGQDAGEYFALFILSVAGLLLVSISNDLVV